MITVPADFISLTAKQKKVYTAIEAFIKAKGIPPTVREIGEMVGEKTPGAVQGILNRLEQKGVIKREIGMARSIQLIQENTNYPAPVYIPEIKKVSRRSANDLLSIYNINKYQPLSSDWVPSHESCFLVKCPDGSLKESGINYNDILVIDRNYVLNEGDILLVLYENHTLLRRYYQGSQKDYIKLKADSDLLNKEDFALEEVLIIGKLAGKFTRY
ncbi:MAG: S24 family peptidase [Clostridiales bacterium]|jgi:repressor LexA|nr:LexA family transcriptional regulator [Eubacteriales bacterium]MDH7566125.1 S24 family peptidase [Clostridiales bacterium]